MALAVAIDGEMVRSESHGTFPGSVLEHGDPAGGLFLEDDPLEGISNSDGDGVYLRGGELLHEGRVEAGVTRPGESGLEIDAPVLHHGPEIGLGIQRRTGKRIPSQHLPRGGRGGP